MLLVALAFDIGTWLYTRAAGWPVEGLAIAAVLLLNAGLSTYQEKRSEQALAQLKPLAGFAAEQITRHDLVAGDAESCVASEP